MTGTVLVSSSEQEMKKHKEFFPYWEIILSILIAEAWFYTWLVLVPSPPSSSLSSNAANLLLSQCYVVT